VVPLGQQILQSAPVVQTGCTCGTSSSGTLNRNSTPSARSYSTIAPIAFSRQTSCAVRANAHDCAVAQRAKKTPATEPQLHSASQRMTSEGDIRINTIHEKHVVPEHAHVKKLLTKNCEKPAIFKGYHGFRDRTRLCKMVPVFSQSDAVGGVSTCRENRFAGTRRNSGSRRDRR